MSVLGKLDRKGLTNLPEILDAFDARMDGWEAKVKIDGKNIEAANIEQASWLAYYDQIKVELRTLVDFMDMKVKEKRGILTNIMIKNMSLDTNERTRERMIDADEEYIRIYQNYLLVNEVYKTAEMIVNSFAQRAYTLTNIVKIRVADVQDITLYIDDR
jgi:hypothetical protein